ncbi:MAG TPA: transposase [Trebonia sp.]|nr:transposase [Trebonia sp.]
MEFSEARSLGATWALDVLWNRLGIGETMRRLLADCSLDDSTERVLFALVANRILAPSARQAAARWVSEDVIISGLPATTDDACSQALDWLPEAKEALENEVFERVTYTPNQEVDLLVFETATTYFETDRPQIAVVAVTRHGIPVLAWNWPGGTADSALIRQVRSDLGDRAPAQTVWVANRGFTTADSRRELSADDRSRYIIAEKLRSGSAEAAAALSRQGRYQEVAANLRIKELRISQDDRFVICHDAEAAERDAAIRARMLAHLGELIRDIDTLSTDMRADKLRGFTVARHGRHRFLRVTASGQFRIDTNAVKAEENLDGKYLLRASDPALSAEDIALRYQRLLDIERGWRSMQQVIDARPVYQHTERSVRAHVLLCWLALLLARVAENACHDTWPKLRQELGHIAVGTFTSPAGTFRQRTEMTPAQLNILTKLAIDPPPRICQLTPPPVPAKP